MRGLIALASECPVVFDQLYYDMELAESKQERDERPGWKRPGETAADARDRLRAEREEAKKRFESLCTASASRT